MSWLRSPALHMAVIGGLMFAVVTLRGSGGEERLKIVIPPHEVEEAFRSFLADSGRVPTAADRARIIDLMIDQEVLYHYALTLGMHEQPAAQRRLAQIAEFVEANPHHAESEEERAEAAMEMGLHHGDLVVRRILTDTAQRLIRGVVLMRDPTEQQLEEYLAANGQLFERPARWRLSQIAVNSFDWPDTEARAHELAKRIANEKLDMPTALALGDESYVEPELPALTEQALITKLGMEFVNTLDELRVGAWSHPVPSRYGHHLVFVHERIDAFVPPLADIRTAVQQRLLHKLADDWLALRLQELRAEFEIELPDIALTQVS